MELHLASTRVAVELDHYIDASSKNEILEFLVIISRAMTTRGTKAKERNHKITTISLPPNKPNSNVSL